MLVALEHGPAQVEEPSVDQWITALHQGLCKLENHDVKLLILIPTVGAEGFQELGQHVMANLKFLAPSSSRAVDTETAVVIRSGKAEVSSIASLGRQVLLVGHQRFILPLALLLLSAPASFLWIFLVIRNQKDLLGAGAWTEVDLTTHLILCCRLARGVGDVPEHDLLVFEFLLAKSHEETADDSFEFWVFDDVKGFNEVLQGGSKDSGLALSLFEVEDVFLKAAEKQLVEKVQFYLFLENSII